ncbi:MAG: hypothetical protein FWF42_01675 [Streptococcaceae bacterium]|nr:hypothetical protein [Streptococcaceae bacterium]MCL2858378.1 hypothetical protein [Streptococcaceae bacterium]
MSKAKIWALIGSGLASIAFIVSTISQFHSLSQFITRVQSQSSDTGMGVMSLMPGLSTFFQSLQTFIVTVIVVLLIVSIAHLVFYWLAFIKMDGSNGKGWSIFLLVIGVQSLVAIASLLIILMSVPYLSQVWSISQSQMIVPVILLVLQVIYNIAFILVFVFKIQELKKSAD